MSAPAGEPLPPDGARSGGGADGGYGGEILPRAAGSGGTGGGGGGGAGASGGTGGAGGIENPQVGSFRQGNLATQWALGRYLVGRVIIARISAGLMVTALAILAIAALVWWLGPNWLAVLIGLLALPVLLVRALIRAVVGRLTEAQVFGPAEEQLRRLVDETGGDFRRELRRVGVPSSIVSFPLLVVRLLRPSSRRTLLTRMRGFDLTRVVPPSRIDELHILITSVRR